jgi:hypothetical protein
VLKRLLLTTVVLVALTATLAVAEDSVLRSLPTDVQKDIEETRARCQRDVDNVNVPAGDLGLVTFTVSGKQAVLVDHKLLCGDCYAGTNCTNRGTRDVRVYVLFGDRWKKFLSNESITGDIFVSNVPGKYRPEGQELNALVVDLYVGNKECPTRQADSSSAQSYEARAAASCAGTARSSHINPCEDRTNVQETHDDRRVLGGADRGR